MSIEAMKLALEALENNPYALAYSKVITSLRQAIANEALNRMAENSRELGLDYKPVQNTQSSIESAASKAVNYRTDYQKPLTVRLQQLADCYDAMKEELGAIKSQPAQREWVGLTDEEIKKFWRDATVKPCYTSELIDTFAKTIEAKLKEKNSAT